MSVLSFDGLTEENPSKAGVLGFDDLAPADGKGVLNFDDLAPEQSPFLNFEDLTPPPPEGQRGRLDAMRREYEAAKTMVGGEDFAKRRELDQAYLAGLRAEGVMPIHESGLSDPILEIPKIKPSDVTSALPFVPEGVAKVAAGAQQGVAEAVDFFTSPLGIATLGTAALPKAGQRLISGVFAAQMASQAPEQFAELGRALGSGDAEAAAKAVVAAGLNVAFLKQGGEHALGAREMGDGSLKVEEARQEPRPALPSEDLGLTESLRGMLAAAENPVVEQTSGPVETAPPEGTPSPGLIEGTAAEGWADKVIQNARGRVSSGLDPEVLAAYGIKGAVLIERGVRNFAEWSDQMLREYGEEVRPHLPDIWRGLPLRAFPQKVDESSDVSSDVKAWAGPRLYEPRTNETDAGLARRIVEEQGVDGASRLFRTEDATVPESVRTALGLHLVKKLGEAEQLAAMMSDKAGEREAIRKQVDLISDVTERSTSMAQGLQAMSMWARMTPAGHLEAYRRVIRGAADKVLGGLRPALDSMRNAVNGVNGEVADGLGRDGDLRRKAGQAIEESVAASPEAHQAVVVEVAGELGAVPEVQRQARELVRNLFAQKLKAARPQASLWGKYKGGAVNSLLKGVEQALSGEAKGKAMLDRFTQNLVDVMRQQLHETLGIDPKAPAAGPTYLQRLMEGLTNPEKFAEVWEQARSRMEAQYGDDPRMQELLAKPAPEVWSPKLLRGVIGEEMKAMQVRLGDLAAGHYQGLDAGKTLRDKIIERTGVGPDEALRLARALDGEFKRMMTAEKAKIAKRLAERRERAAAREERIRKSRSVWDREKKGLAEKMAWLVERRRKAPGPDGAAMEEFGKRLATALRGQLVRLLPEKAGALGKLTDMQLVREGITNAEHYQAAWEAAQTEMRARFAGQPEVLKELDQFFGEVSPNPFNESALDRLVRTRMTEAGVRLPQLVREHYTAVDATGKGLAEKLVAESGLTADAARRLAAAVEVKFKEKATAAKVAALKRLSLPLKLGTLRRPELHRRIIEASNLGALSDEGFYRLVRERLGLPEWSKETAGEVVKRANEIQRTPEGFQQQRKVADLLSLIERQKGVRWQDLAMPFWYGDILSGPVTHAVNMASNVWNLATHVGIEIAKRPGATPGLLASLARGAGKGVLDAAEVLRSGVVTGTRAGKATAGRPLELMKFEGLATPLNAWKYVFRALAAEDLLFFKPAEEMRQYAAARIVAKREGLSGAGLRQRVSDILGNVDERVEAARAQAAQEGLTGLDARRRAGEIIEQSRPAEMRENARQYALRVTYNNKPYGVLGHMAEGLNKFLSRVPLFRTVIPFVDIIANVTNESLNYVPPVGIARALWGHWAGKLEGQPMDREALMDQTAKAFMGTALLGGLAVLAAKYKDDEDPYFAVNGAGPRTYDQVKQLKETGWTPYTVKIGDHYISYGQMPVAIPLAMLGNYMDAMRYKHLEETDAVNRVAYALFSSGKVMTQQAFLGSISDMFTLLNRDPTKHAGDVGVKRVAQVASGFVIPNALKQVDRIFDPTVYDSTGVQAALTAQVPFVRRAGKPALNVLGEPVRSLVSDRFMSVNRKNEIWQVLAAKQAWISVPDKDTIIGDQKRGPDHFRTMTPTEWYDYVAESGERIRNALDAKLGSIEMKEPAAARKMVDEIVERERARVKRSFRP